MSNPAFTSVCIEGDRREVRSLYGKMMRLQEREKPLVENGYFYPTRWLGNLVVRLGADWREVTSRGTWDFLGMENGHLFFMTQTAWNPPYELFHLILQRFPGLHVYFEAEGDDWDSYLTNDGEGRYFTSRYVIDAEPDVEYFDTIAEARTHLEAIVGRPLAEDWHALYEAAEEWNDQHPVANWPICVKRFEVLEDGEW